MARKDEGPELFELKLANGKTRSFKTGYDMWKWASHSSPKMEFSSDERASVSLSDWFERRKKN